jgi:hypothetical protein
MEAAETELTATTEGSPIPLTRWAGLIGLGAVAYPLGIGPAYWLTIHEWLPDSASVFISVFIHSTLYRPLWWVCDRSGWVAGPGAYSRRPGERYRALFARQMCERLSATLAVTARWSSADRWL